MLNPILKIGDQRGMFNLWVYVAAINCFNLFLTTPSYPQDPLHLDMRSISSCNLPKLECYMPTNFCHCSSPKHILLREVLPWYHQECLMPKIQTMIQILDSTPNRPIIPMQPDNVIFAYLELLLRVMTIPKD